MRLIPNTAPAAQCAEDPYFAQGLVSNALTQGRHTLKGLEALQRTSHIVRDADIVEAVRRGEWLLVADEVASSSASGLLPGSESSPPRAYIFEDRWPLPKVREDLVFAKSCRPDNWGRTRPGVEVEPASRFGNVMLSGAMALPVSATTALNAGAEAALVRIAGGGIMQHGFTWALRGPGVASNPASLFLLGLLPTRLGDGALYTDSRLRDLEQVPTRVRFQIRRDAHGGLQVYGIHAHPDGDDAVRTVKAIWRDDQRTMEAHVNGLTILWIPNKGSQPIPPLIHPEHTGERIDNILVHPIATDTDSQIEIYPGSEDITTDDFILTFPADSGMKSLYIAYAIPHSHYQPPPDHLLAFPAAKEAKRKTPISGGGGKRKRWKDDEGYIYEWDSAHGAVEKYDRRGRHLGEFNPVTGEKNKDADPVRRVEP